MIPNKSIERESPWGPMAIADAHVHFFGHRFWTAVAAQKPGLTAEAMAAQLGWVPPPLEPERTDDVARHADRLVAGDDRRHVVLDEAVLDLPLRGGDEGVSSSCAK